MERLTNFQGLLACCIGCQHEYECYEESCGMIEAAIKKLADYEDKEEQGLLIELPVPLGTKVFCLDGVLDSIVINEWKFCVQMLDEWGEYVFATRSEAEEALAKMGGK